MRKQSEINRLIDVLKFRSDVISRVQLEVLECKRSESWVFNHYVHDVPENERNERLFYAARDAAQYLSGKIGISAICPELEDSPEDVDEDTITIPRSEFDKLLKRLERVERRLGLRVGSVEKAERKDISEAPDDLIPQVEACRYIGCGKSTIKRWADRASSNCRIWNLALLLR